MYIQFFIVETTPRATRLYSDILAHTKIYAVIKSIENIVH